MFLTTPSAPIKGCLRRHFLEVASTPPLEEGNSSSFAIMLRTRKDIYQPGFPAPPGEHYGAFIRFAKRHAGASILDLGCGYGAYSVALVKEGLKCIGCDINRDYLRTAVQHGLPVVNVDTMLPFSDRSF